MQNNPYTKESEKNIEREKERVKDFASAAVSEGEEKMRTVASSAERKLREGEEKMRNVASHAERKIREGEEQLKQFATDVDRQLHDNPWPLVTGIAATCLLLGFVMGITKKN